MTSALQYALSYACRGWRVLPVSKKIPLIKNWPELATADEATIKEWWSQSYATAGVGIATGEASGLVVIDIDPRHNGEAGLDELERRYGKLPPTTTSQTGGCGLHLYFKYPAGATIRTTTRLSGVDGVDVRGEGGYVVAPPSIHESGRRYEWLGNAELSSLPAGWAVLLSNPAGSTPAGAAGNGEHRPLSRTTLDYLVNGCREGERNNRLFKAGTDLAGCGFSIDEARVKLVAVATATGLDDREAERTIASAYGKPREPALKVAQAVCVAQRVPADLIRMADVTPERLAWLWPGRFPMGKLALLAGDPSLGKSLLTLDMAARVSRGTCWLDCRDAPNPAGSVLMLSAEDDAADTIKPRLMAAGADCERITLLSTVTDGDGKRRPFTLADVPMLDAALATLGDVRLVIIDPVSAYLGAADSHKNAEVRALLGPLAALAQDRRIAVLAVTHNTKNYGGKALYRAMGSLAFVAAARAAWAVLPDPADPAHRALLPIKSNLSPTMNGLGYKLESVPVDGLDDQPVIAWDAATIDVRADDWMRAESEPAGAARDAAGNWLRDLLADGPVKSADVQTAAKASGFTWATVRRAKDTLRIRASKRGFTDGAWYWLLPAPEDAQITEDAQGNTLSAFDASERLRALASDNGQPVPDPATAAVEADQRGRGLA